MLNTIFRWSIIAAESDPSPEQSFSFLQLFDYRAAHRPQICLRLIGRIRALLFEHAKESHRFSRLLEGAAFFRLQVVA